MNLSECPGQRLWAGLARKAAVLRDQPWFRLVWATNPFYLFSATLLLYGIYRVSIDPRLFGSDLGQLFFNFAALQVYDWLLVLTAVALARRWIDYESTLLLFLENTFVLIPFILVSHAVFLGPQASWTVCLTGGVFAVLQFALLKRRFPGLNLPPMQLLAGSLFLAANILFPLMFRHGLENNNESWGSTSLYCWQIVLPLLLGFVNLLPRGRLVCGGSASRPWVPVMTMFLWAAVSCSHLWTIHYVDERPLRLGLFLPLLWVLSWTVCNRSEDVFPSLAGRRRDVLMCLPLAVSACGVAEFGGYAYFAVAVLNVVVFGGLCLLNRNNVAAARGLLLGLGVALASIPEPLGLALSANFGRPRAVLGGICVTALIGAWFSRNPKLGLAGSLAVGLATGNIFASSEVPFHLAFQAGAFFFMLHSLKWDRAADPSCAKTFGLVGAVWMADALALQSAGDLSIRLAPSLLALPLLAVVGVRRILFGKASHWAVGACAALVGLCFPLCSLGRMASVVPQGVLAVLGSFLLFGIGTGLALLKSRKTAHPAAALVSRK